MVGDDSLTWDAYISALPCTILGCRVWRLLGCSGSGLEVGVVARERIFASSCSIRFVCAVTSAVSVEILLANALVVSRTSSSLVMSGRGRLDRFRGVELDSGAGSVTGGFSDVLGDALGAL
jgi:hypothetical protein